MPPTQNKKRERKTISLEIKSRVIRLNENGVKISTIGRELNLPRSTVQTILKEKTKLTKAIDNGVSLNSTVIRSRGGLVAVMEKILVTWIQNQIELQASLNMATIQNMALNIYQTLKDEQVEKTDETFRASRGWYSRFKARHTLHNIQSEAEVSTSDFPQIIEGVKIEEADNEPLKELTLEQLSEAFDNLKNAMKIFEENDCNTTRSLEVTNKIVAAYQCYRELYESKKKIGQKT